MKSGSDTQQPATHGPSMCQAVDVTGWLGGILYGGICWDVFRVTEGTLI